MPVNNASYTRAAAIYRCEALPVRVCGDFSLRQYHKAGRAIRAVYARSQRLVRFGHFWAEMPKSGLYRIMLYSTCAFENFRIYSATDF